ncbi:MFS transporter [Micromonospora sp. CA-111912]|uniref:MFS transporter n=1 Tax=Micromonospora sp. CA-111912 TaxID=3239955 RepID=UPI003D8A301E
MVEATGLSRGAGRREWVALGVLTLAVVLLAVDGTVLALAVPALTADLNPSATQLLWIGDIYSFALAGLLVTMGNLADRIGRKRLLLIGTVGFGLASVLAAFAPSAELLIAARVLLGVSGATLMPSTLSIIRNMFEVPAQRTRAIAIWSAGATGGAALGPLVGGALLERFWWGSVFLINVPVMVALLIAGALLLPESRNPHSGPIDLRSAALSVATILPVVYAIKHTVSAGFELQGAGAALIGLAAGVWFVRRQRRLTYPLVDVSLFRMPAFAGAVSANTISIFAFSGLLFFFSQYLQLVRGFSPLQAGIAELPSTIAAIGVIFFVGALITRLGRGPAIGAGLLVAALGLVLLAVAEGLPTYLWIAVAIAVIGLGVGVSMTLATDAVVDAVPRERAGAAASISETGYELGIALGIAVLGSVQTLFYRLQLTVPGDVSQGDREAVTESLASATRVLADRGPEAMALLEQARHAFTGGMQVTAVIAAALTLLAGIIAWRVVPPVGKRQVQPADLRKEK